MQNKQILISIHHTTFSIKQVLFDIAHCKFKAQAKTRKYVTLPGGKKV